ncbi:DNA replication/repair protein RecF [Deinococcus peraridilitoris]|uniref:DNA replication and repair protein RecF n=1 Tax=Deinococcus peraridilitoris (strain DSM 19664 / LMG 22246 / CIP 109416 / KR-200) TaxID=937777 RepID=K9ZYX9_DEIPD|nr:DNA replication and repair protein RecF [Deinococcus peraridilitoris]AFZ65965.1 recF protein [Deinococcus peraridilitoris DSM 19664]
MRLRALTTLNFRNLTPDTLELPAGLVSVSGANGAGKTNLLEAAYLVLTGLTEAGRLEQLVARGSGEAYVRADLERQDGVSILEVGLGRGRRVAKVDGVRVRSGALPPGSAVWIRPEDSELILGAPGVRRTFLDALLSRLSQRYAHQLSLYERHLAQRNAALRAMTSRVGEGRAEPWALDVWDAKVVELGTEILSLRRRVLARLTPLAQEAHEALGGHKALTLNLDETTTPEDFHADLLRRRDEELARGVTLSGPHRDDLAMRLDDFPAGDFVSRGEARTIALALRKAELDLLTERYGEPPVLLVDDWTAELDPQRRNFLLGLARALPQALITGTDAVPGAAGCYAAHDGSFSWQGGSA